jgi:hypothetical protein
VKHSFTHSIRVFFFPCLFSLLCVFSSCSCYKLDMEDLGDISSIFLSFVNEDPNDSISLLLSELLTMGATFFPTKADVSS